MEIITSSWCITQFNIGCLLLLAIPLIAYIKETKFNKDGVDKREVGDNHV